MIPWSSPHARITTRLEYAILRLCQTMTQKAAADLLRLSASTLSEQLHRSVMRRRTSHRIRRLRVIGIDEISYHKRHRYATLVYDLERSVVVWVGQGRGRETIDRFFNEMLSPYQRAQIHTACCDMIEAYMGAIRAYCHNGVCQRSCPIFSRDFLFRRAFRFQVSWRVQPDLADWRPVPRVT
jgi:transposase